MQAKWIWIDDKKEEDTYAEFYDKFISDGEKTVLFISADADYSVSVNGKYVYSGQYADFPWYKVHDEIEITKYLNKGENEIIITVWFCGDKNFCHYINRGGLLYEIKEDENVIAYSSRKTLCRKAPYYVSGYKKILTFQIGYSFLYDFNQQTEKYYYSIEINDMPNITFKRPIKLLSIGDKINAVKKGNIYDLGCETVGFPFVKFKGNKNAHLTVSFGERAEGVTRIIDNYDVLEKNNHYDFSYEIKCSGQDESMFNPLRKIGCRYFKVEGDCDVFEIGIIPVEYPFEKKRYQFDSLEHQKIYDTAVKTLLCNALEHYMDCPWREQAFWALDSRFQMKYGYVAFNGYDYQRANLKLMCEDKSFDGFSSMVVPSSDNGIIPLFTLYFIIAVVEYTEISQDLTLINEYYDKLAGYLETYINNIKDGLVACFENKWNFYEWNETLSGDSKEKFDCVLNCAVIFALDNFINVIERLNKTVRANRYREIVKGLKKSVYNNFYNKEKGLFRTFIDKENYSELANALAVLCGAIEGDLAKRICDALSDKNDMIKTTLSMKAIKYDALIKVSKTEYKSYIINDIDKCFGYMLDNGATTFWETMKGGADFNGTGSLCHGWSALPIYYYNLLGICK